MKEEVEAVLTRNQERNRKAKKCDPSHVPAIRKDQLLIPGSPPPLLPGPSHTGLQSVFSLPTIRKCVRMAVSLSPIQWHQEERHSRSSEKKKKNKETRVSS